MKYQSRRIERTEASVGLLKSRFKHVIDLTHFEKTGKALEGKGSLVFDHINRVIYCALSQRSHIEVVTEL